ncbi:MAG: alpha/beta fold hydrolase [Proteobacteria bacterium]|nr:alpha/beta fold hydrolase [Pseudomonadota bacterium]
MRFDQAQARPERCRDRHHHHRLRVLPATRSDSPQARRDPAAGRRSGLFLDRNTRCYINIFNALRNRRDILIVDKRGTGTSAAIDCPGVQQGDPSDPAAIAACGQQLGAKAALYRTELAVADIVGVMDALQISKVDFYGDSYGTYVGQTFAARHGGRLRSIILDSAYPVRPPDIWFPTDWARGRDGLDRVCERSSSCQALGGKSTWRMQSLLNYLRQHPISGRRPTPTACRWRRRSTCRSFSG